MRAGLMRKAAVAAVFVALHAAGGAAPALAISDKPYVTTAEIDTIMLLAPPPAPGSEHYKRDLEQLLAIQKSRTPEQIERAQIGGDFQGFDNVLGAKFTAANLPTASAFIRKVTRETTVAVDRVKDCWEKVRPFVASKKIRPVPGSFESMMIKPGTSLENAAPHGPGSPCKAPETNPAASYSYPSGGANVGITAAVLLASMVPEKRAEIFARGWEYGENRMVLGVHWPSDVEASKIAATAMIAAMMQNPEFKSDLTAARAEVRRVLGLAP